MEINRETLIKLLEAFADTSEVLHRELMLYQLLFLSACKSKGLKEDEIQKDIARARIERLGEIDMVSQAAFQSLRGKLPQLVDLLSSDEDAAVRFLEKWGSGGLAN